MKKLGISGSITLLLILRALYSMNWYNVSPMLFRITSTYNVSASLSGLVLSAFLIGTGAFQIPSGLIASKIGSRNTALVGMIIMSISTILTLLSFNFTEFLLTRLFVGIGSAFFFSSGIAVLNDIDSKNVSRNIGAFNTAFSIGGGFGVVGFAFLVSYINWAILLEIGGLVTLIFTLLAFLFITDMSPRGAKKDFRKNIMKRLTSKPLILLSLSMAGYWGLNFTLEEYLQPFAVKLGFSTGIAGAIGSLSLFAGLIGMFLFVYFSRRKLSVVLPSLAIFISIIIAFQFFAIPPYLFATSLIAGSVSVIIFSLEYSYVVTFEEEKQYVAFGISIMNAIQIATGSVITLVFGLLFSLTDTFSWIVLAIISVAFVPLGIPIWKKGS